MLPLCILSCCCLVSLLECLKSSHACHMCYFCSCLCIVCWNVSEALMLATMCLFVFLPVYGLFNCFRRSHACQIVFGSVLACAKSAHAFLKLSYSLRRLSFLNNSSSESKAFLCFIAFSGSPTAVHHAFLFFNAKAWPQSQTDLFTCTTKCGHTFLRCIALHCVHYGIHCDHTFLNLS